MPSEHQNFELRQGVDKTIQITVTDNNGDAVDLSGAALTWIVATAPNGTTKFTKEEDSAGTITLDSTGSVVSIDIDDTDTAALEGEYYHELLSVDGNGDKTILTTGWVLIHPSQQT